MRRFRMHLGVAALTLTTLVAAGRVEARTAKWATPRPISFGTLQRGDTLRIDYGSSGCFSSTRAEVLILGNEPSVARVVVWEAGPVPKEAPLEPKRRTVHLTRKDRRGLDRLLAFYRAPHSNGCTTVDHVTLTLSHNGMTVQSESFVDGSCGVHEEPGVLTLDEIVRLRT